MLHCYCGVRVELGWCKGVNVVLGLGNCGVSVELSLY